MLMLDQNVNMTIIPRWLSLTCACSYAPAIGKKKLVVLLKSGEIYGVQSGEQGKWIVDRLSIDQYFLREQESVKSLLAEMRGTR